MHGITKKLAAVHRPQRRLCQVAAARLANKERLCKYSNSAAAGTDNLQQNRRFLTFLSFFLWFFRALRSSSTAFSASDLSMNLMPASISWRQFASCSHEDREVLMLHAAAGCSLVMGSDLQLGRKLNYLLAATAVHLVRW